MEGLSGQSELRAPANAGVSCASPVSLSAWPLTYGPPRAQARGATRHWALWRKSGDDQGLTAGLSIGMPRARHIRNVSKATYSGAP